MTYESHIDGVIGLVVGAASTAVILARMWWTGKTREQKKAVVKDTLAALADKKISLEEARDFIDEHF